MMLGYPRLDGTVGIRNYIAVVYLVECAHHVARMIAYQGGEQCHLIGFPGCYPNEEAFEMMKKICTHPNVGGVVLVSLGCEEFNRSGLEKYIRESGRPVKTGVIQRLGGTTKSIEQGLKWIEEIQSSIKEIDLVEVKISDLVIGVKCGGSDGFSGLSANPAIGKASDILVDLGSSVVFEETCELLGCENHMSSRGVNENVQQKLLKAVQKADDYYKKIGHGSFGGGNITGGLSTVEEKSLGSYAKSGSKPITDVINPRQTLEKKGLFLLDTVYDGDVKYGIPNENDTHTITELFAIGCHIILFSTGRGSVVGQALCPVIKICSNSVTYNRMEDNMDVNAGDIIDGNRSLEEVGQEIVENIKVVSSGNKTKSEILGHQEFYLRYMNYNNEPACFPV